MLDIITYGTPILETKSARIERIDETIDELIEEMFETMYENKGIGLVAVQIGRPLRLFITHTPKDSPRVFINPEIIETSIEEEESDEGCLSLPGVTVPVTRASRVRVQAMSRRGRRKTTEAFDLLSRVIQHELDHLNGILILDHIDSSVREQALKDLRG